MQDQELKALILTLLDEGNPASFHAINQGVRDVGQSVETGQVYSAVRGLMNEDVLSHSGGLLRAGPRFRSA